MPRSSSLLAFLFTLAVSAAPAGAVTNFTAMLDGAQAGVVTEAFGSATLVLNDPQTRLEINIQLNGIDLAAPGARAHIHNAPPGVGGPVVFGMLDPDHDLNMETVVDAMAGTIFAGWDVGEGNNTDLAAQLANLLAGNLYINIHTEGSPGGEIRGQIVPEPGTFALLALGMGALAYVGRR